MSFFKGVGEKIFGGNKEVDPATAATVEPLRASALLAHVKSLGLAYNSLRAKNYCYRPKWCKASPRAATPLKPC